MATLTLAEAKTYLRVCGTQDDNLIQSLMTAADIYLTNKISKTKLNIGESGGTVQYTPLQETQLYKQGQLMLIAHWFENRSINITNTMGTKNPIAVDDIIKSIDLASEYE